MREDLLISARLNCQSLDGYGKNSDTDTLEMPDINVATITAIGAGKQLKSGDIFYINPFLVSAEAETVAAPSDGQTLSLIVRYPRIQRGVATKKVDIAFTTAETTLDLAITKINSVLSENFLSDHILAEKVGADKLRIVSIHTMSTFGVYPESTWDHKIVLDPAKATGNLPTMAEQYLYSVIKDISTAETVVDLSPYHETVKNKEFSISEGTLTRYSVLRNIGQSTSSTLETTEDSVIYKGQSFLATQVEYPEGAVTFTINEQEYFRDNLRYIKNWRYETSKVAPSGKIMSEAYTLRGDTQPQDIEIMSFAHDVKDNLNTIYIERAKSQAMEISTSKTEFRTYTDTMMALTPDSKLVATISWQK